MKKLFSAVFLFLCFSAAFAQDCVDTTLIDPSVMCEASFFPVCGCDGNTYPNSCEAYYTYGISEWTNGSCESQIDTCVNQVQLEWGQTIDCTAEYAPVCGCDQVTYTNACNAFYYGGVSTYSIGACNTGVYCPIVPSMVDFGLCDMPLGFLRTPQGCVMMSGCSRTGSNGVDYSEYFFEFEYACNSTCDTSVVIECVNPAQIDSTMGCLTVYDPVCGCDGVTYSNECEAYNYAGITIWTPGECATAGLKEESAASLIGFPNPVVGVLTVKVASPQTTLSFFNNQGSLLYRTTSAQSTSVQVDMTGWPAGVYLVQAQTDSGVQTLRVVRE